MDWPAPSPWVIKMPYKFFWGSSKDNNSFRNCKWKAACDMMLLHSGTKENVAVFLIQKCTWVIYEYMKSARGQTFYNDPMGAGQNQNLSLFICNEKETNVRKTSWHFKKIAHFEEEWKLLLINLQAECKTESSHLLITPHLHFVWMFHFSNVNFPFTSFPSSLLTYNTCYILGRQQMFISLD